MSNTLQTLSELKGAIKSKWIFILLGGILVAGLVGFITKSQKGMYEAYSKIFPLAINKASGGGVFDAMKAQFGISDKTDFDKIYNVKELVTSKAVSHQIVNSQTSNLKFKKISHWLIDDYNQSKPFWKSKIVINPKDTNATLYTGASLFLSNTKIDNDAKTGFIKIVTQASQPELAKELNEKILKGLSEYYIKLVTEKPRTDLNTIRIMRDSLKNELYANERAIAGFIDANQMSVKTTTQLPQSKLMRNQKEIEQLYTTAATSYQNAKFKLLSESPIFQVLDSPGPPYNFNKPSTVKMGLVAFIITTFLLVLFFSRKVFGRMILEELSKA